MDDEAEETQREQHADVEELPRKVVGNLIAPVDSYRVHVQQRLATSDQPHKVRTPRDGTLPGGDHRHAEALVPAGGVRGPRGLEIPELSQRADQR